VRNCDVVKRQFQKSRQGRLTIAQHFSAGTKLKNNV
jgi:hypothetical protein